MSNNRRFVVSILTVLLMIMTACGNSSDKSSDPTGAVDSSQTESTTEEHLDLVDETEVNDQEETTSDLAEDLPDEEASESGDDANQVSKTEYLEKLNQMEEADRYAESGSTIAELEEQETARYQKWDEELNRIYAILTEQLSSEAMEELREEQRDWIAFRDESAKEASLEYEGGTTESLEYIATQASLTRERCYLLVAQYLD